MIVYRVEHGEVIDPETKRPAGPFRSISFSTAWQGERKRLLTYCEAQERLYTHIQGGYYPTPWADPNLCYITPDEICGFANEASVKEWFGSSWPIFESVGFKINRYEVPDCDARRGEVGQVLFKFKNAQRVNV